MDKLYLGNLDAKRDWGHAGEYIKAMYAMLQQEEPEDFVIGTGESHSVKEFVETAFKMLDLNWEDHVEVDKELYRPAEVDLLIADSRKTKKQLKWNYDITFEELVEEMVKNDLEMYEDTTFRSKSAV